MRVVALLLLLLAMPWGSAQAQSGPATLVADRVVFDDERLVAEGNVEVFAEGRVLRASRITYLREEDRLLVEGPLTLVDGPNTLLVADFASLNGNLRGSILRGARLVLDRRLQLAATEVATGAEGRFTELYQTVASACEICEDGQVPLWQIRARRIVHDRERRQIFFENARFEVVGIPVAWLPLLRVPDPTVRRARGFLVPRFSSSDLLGTGIALPYFLPLGPSRDLTLIPFVTESDTQSLGFRYRQAFEAGEIGIVGAVSGDDVRPGETRGYLFAEGLFFLPRDHELQFDVELTADEDYLVDYDITDKDRLDSRIAITRVDRDDKVLAEIIAFNTLREDEQNKFLPTPVFTIERQKRTTLPFVGGQALFLGQVHGRWRTADEVPAGLPPDAARDTLRASFGLDWQRSHVTGFGLVATALGGVHVDAYDVRQDPEFVDESFLRTVPYGGFELRMPFARAGAGGVRHVIEPVAQLVLAPDDRLETPDEDSLTPEFDEGNLFSAQRFAGRDIRELGNRLNLGVSYTRYDPSGWKVGGTVGRILREEDPDQFATGTGLAGDASDWLISGSAVLDERFSLLQRTLFDGGFDTRRSDTILKWEGIRHELETRFTWLEADEEVGRPIDTSEWSLAARYDLSRDWTGRVNWRYDFVTDEPSRAGLGLTYRSECIEVDVNVETRFTSGGTLQSSTRFGFGVQLAGFGATERRDRRSRCGI